MGGACSRKRDQQVSEDTVHRGFGGRYNKSGSSKWLGTLISRAAIDIKHGHGTCPSLMELCIRKTCEEINNYSSFSMLPRDVSQQIINELIWSRILTEANLEAFRDCAVQDLDFGGYPGFDDKWLDVVSSQGQSLLSVDLSGSDVTDSGLKNLKDCENLQCLGLNYCDQISDHGLECISSLSNLTALSLKRNSSITAQGMSSLAGLVNLLKLDLERCPGIHGGLVHLKDMKKLESLNINCCNCITDADMKPLSELTSLKGLQISSSNVTDDGVSFLKGLSKLTLLNMEGCPVSAASLDSISALTALLYLNLSRCCLTDDGCEKLSRLETLKVLNLGYNEISDAVLVHLRGYSFHYVYVRVCGDILLCSEIVVFFLRNLNGPNQNSQFKCVSSIQWPHSPKALNGIVTWYQSLKAKTCVLLRCLELCSLVFTEVDTPSLVFVLEMGCW